MPRRLISWIVLGLAVAVGCGGATEEGRGLTPPRAENPNPRPPLGAEPPAPADLPGRAWLEAIHARIYPRWSDGFLESCRVYLPNEHVLNELSLEATVAFTVRADGRVTRVELVKPSRASEYDAAVLEIVRELDELGPPPAELRSDDGFVYLTWRFARDERQASLAGAQIDRRLAPLEQAIPALLAAHHVDEALARLAAAPGATVAQVRALAGAIVEAALAPTVEAGVRVQAVRAAGRGGLVALAPRLVELAKVDRDLAVRVAAIEALGVLGHAPAVPALLEILGDLDGERSAAAGAALAAMGKASEAWSKVQPALAAPATRAAALVALRGVGASAASGPLALLLQDAKAPRAERVLAAQALGAVGARPDGAAALKALVGATEKVDAGLRAAAVTALWHAGEAGARSKALAYALAPARKDKDGLVRAGALAAAGLLGPGVAGPELATLAGRETAPEVLEALAAGLAAAPAKVALAPLTALARSEVPTVRARALRALASRDEPEAKALVAAQTSDPEPTLRVLAIRAQTDARVAGIGLADDQPTVRAAALEAVVRLGGPDAALGDALRALAAEPAALRLAAAEGWLAGTAGR